MDAAFKAMQIAAWTASAGFALWLVVDLLRTNSRYGEDVLMSSREGEIEDEMKVEHMQGGGA